ncbi:MAG: hypothetical protein K2Y56_13220 [Methylobacterium sp.]|uniref:hypothetical protein n=1 Tax=Methylobacterium sp. TaxID=409 RepID=UPI0025F3D3EB|nr:hypothetical protein [Methylobacterium sp.]MBX9932480.1 hypothetical protein [Methylobacterium sp.]
MTEKKVPHVDAMRTTTTTHEVDASDVKADSVRTTIHSSDLDASSVKDGMKVDHRGRTKEAPEIEGSHTQETIDPAERLAEDPEHENDDA